MPRRPFPCLVAVLATTVAASLACTAQAAEPAQPESSFSAGLGLAVLPKYSGADEWRAVPLLDISYANKNGFFAGTRQGIGFRTAAGPVEVSAALGYDSGRRESNSRRRFGSEALRGMGDIRGAALANLAVGYDLGFMTLGVKAELALTHRERGNRYEFAASMPLLTEGRDQVALFGSLDVADRKNMQAFYGVTETQSRNAGYRVYTPKAGVEKVGVGVSWNRQLGGAWSVRTMGGAYTLLGDAADSPIVKRKTAPVFMTSLNYRF